MKNILQKIYEFLIKSYEISRGLRDIHGDYITDYTTIIPIMSEKL